MDDPKYLVVRNAFLQVSNRGRVTRILQRIRDADFGAGTNLFRGPQKFYDDGRYLPYSDESTRGMPSVSLVSVQVNIKLSWSLAPLSLLPSKFAPTHPHQQIS